MNHDEYRIRLDDDLDGSLPDAERRQMEQHAAECAACAALRAETAAIVEAARHLPRSVEPASDSWPRLSRAIAAHGAQARRRRAAGAALTAIAASVVVAFGVVFMRSRLQPGDGSFAAQLAAENFTGLVTGLELECNGVGRSLQASLAMPAASSTPTVAAWTPEVAEAVEILDRSIAETRSALEQEPGNLTLQAQLAMRYQQKLAVLQLALACADKA